MPGPSPVPLLVTGCYRSGTTVVEKILNMHPRLTVASQPFPVLYFLAKELFNQEIGIERRYPLDHLFLETAYTAGELDAFLNRTILSQDTLELFTRRMAAYTDGLWTPEILSHLGDLNPGNFFDIYRQLNQRIADLFPNEQALYVGGKEVLVEEFALPLIHSGARVVFVVRDPRAMIASLNFRERDNLTGKLRPVLYSLRAWRKSIALAITAAGRGGAVMVRYEDLVQDQVVTLGLLTGFLGVDAYAGDAFERGILDQHRQAWSGNSSFADQQGISGSSLTAYRHRLPPATRDFIEAVCQPEMALLDYRSDGSARDHQHALDTYRDPFRSIHPSFPADYSHQQDRVAAERKRLQLLRHGGLGPDEQRKWFISQEAWSALTGTAP